MTWTARRLWQLTEPIHALTYFSSLAAQSFESAGLRGFWRGYFASRAAPLGQVEAAPVTAIFFGFHHDFVQRALPNIWNHVSPSDALEARTIGSRAAIQSLCGPAEVSTDVLVRVGEILMPAVTAAATEHRPLGLANALLEPPSDPASVVWHACTVIREHRGDGHVSTLHTHDLDPCEASTLKCAVSGTDVELIASVRGWPQEAWVAARERLEARQLVVAGTVALEATDNGRELTAAVEAATDALAAAPFVAIADDLDELSDLLAPLLGEITNSGVVPFPNPIGVDRPN